MFRREIEAMITKINKRRKKNNQNQTNHFEIYINDPKKRQGKQTKKVNSVGHKRISR